jgi:hypothetical protein
MPAKLSLLRKWRVGVLRTEDARQEIIAGRFNCSIIEESSSITRSRLDRKEIVSAGQIAACPLAGTVKYLFDYILFKRGGLIR